MAMHNNIVRAHRTNVVVSEEGSVTLHDLPFKEGDKLEVFLIQQKSEDVASSARQDVRGKEQVMKGSARAMAQSALVGLWEDRDDIGSSQEFARKLREQAQHRSIKQDNDG